MFELNKGKTLIYTIEYRLKQSMIMYRISIIRIMILIMNRGFKKGKNMEYYYKIFIIFTYCSLTSRNLLTADLTDAAAVVE